jgi:NAD(P)H-flavin reductase
MADSAAGPMTPRLFVIHRVRRETHDTFTFELLPNGDSPGFSFAAGQFNMLYHFGVGEVPISISGDPMRTGILLHTTRAVGTVTNALKRLKRGDQLGVRGPFGTSWPVEKAIGQDVLIISGGIGLAPLRPVIYQILSHRHQYGRLILLYGARTPAEILFQKELEQWGQQRNIDVEVTVDRAGEKWEGPVGVVTALISQVSLIPFNTLAMICGPELMMRFTIRELRKNGLPEENIYVSMERNMKCGVGHCGHCQLGAAFVCKDGPIFPYTRAKEFFVKREM